MLEDDLQNPQSTGLYIYQPIYHHLHLLFPGVSSNPSINQPGREKDIRLAVDLEDLWVHPGCPPQGSRRKLGDPRTDKNGGFIAGKKQQILENPLNNL